MAGGVYAMTAGVCMACAKVQQPCEVVEPCSCPRLVAGSLAVSARAWHSPDSTVLKGFGQPLFPLH